MFISLKQLLRIGLLFTAVDAALVLFPVTAHAGSGFRRAMDAGTDRGQQGRGPRQHRQNKTTNDSLCGWGRKI